MKKGPGKGLLRTRDRRRSAQEVGHEGKGGGELSRWEEASEGKGELLGSARMGIAGPIGLAEINPTNVGFLKPEEFHLVACPYFVGALLRRRLKCCPWYF
jgi:hypothetical protein